jgi:signal transduction histidine kinase
VANILGISHLIEASPKMSKADFKKCVEGLISSIKKLDEVIVDLNFILQKRTSISEKKETINLNQLVSDIKVLIGKHAHLESVSIRTDFSAANEVFTIKSFLHSILLNLIINSIKYRNPATDSFIEITTEKKGGKVVFSLKDNGLGIDMETHGEKLFGLYKKFHPHIEGKGMGLYMVKTQVELLQGSISVESAVNKGTTFRFSID